MTEAEWLACADLEAMLGFLAGCVSERKLRLFACACVRLGWEDMPEERCRKAVERAEEFADGRTTRAQLRQTRRDVTQAMAEIIRTAHLGYCFCEAAKRVATEKNVLNGIKQAQRTLWYSPRHDRAASLPVLLRDICGNPFRPVALDPAWRTSDVLALARGIYEERAFDRMRIRADAIQGAGCDSDELLNHCRDANQAHVRGCWALDLMLGKK